MAPSLLVVIGLISYNETLQSVIMNIYMKNSLNNILVAPMCYIH